MGNRAIKRELGIIQLLTEQGKKLSDELEASELFLKIRSGLNNLMDLEKHYSRKENLIFSDLEMQTH